MASVYHYDAHAARRQGGWIQHGALDSEGDMT